LEEHNANVAKWRDIESLQATLPTTVASTAPVQDGLPVPPTPPPAPVAAATPPELPKPVEVAATEPAAVTETTAPSTVIKPVPKPSTLTASSLQPGTWLMVANQLVPIPKQKPRQ
jgi:hypothetical protein